MYFKHSINTNQAIRAVHLCQMVHDVLAFLVAQAHHDHLLNQSAAALEVQMLLGYLYYLSGQITLHNTSQQFG